MEITLVVLSALLWLGVSAIIGGIVLFGFSKTKFGKQCLNDLFDLTENN